jgi:UDP-N-acetylmuramoyl-L-alanyl-D-glutamate--2,6-diaminopimelate ligase
MKKLIKKLIPIKLLLFYHYILAMLATAYYRFPSKKMIVIGITGTKGKTSAANFIWACLRAGGYKTGIISTANIRIGEKENLNKYHMTMPGRFAIQRLLADMVRDGCTHCVVETTSEGIKQHRHVGVYYDVAVFTGLSPEHLHSHEGSFEKYKKMKGKMFSALSAHGHKVIDGKKIEKVIVVNNDNEHKDYFLQFKADKKIKFGLSGSADVAASNIKETAHGIEFTTDGETFSTSILGKFNVYNILPAIVISHLFSMDKESIRRGLKDLKLIPGRMEVLNEGQSFRVIVDYAHEKESITNVLNTIDNLRTGDSKIIILLGAEGGGRDKAKRPVMGRVSAEKADYVIVSNVDPYEDDPSVIAEDIAAAAEKAGKVRNKNLFVIEDRREGIRKALSLADKDDVVIITGKGAEQSITINGITSAWDDRIVTRACLKALRSTARP